MKHRFLRLVLLFLLLGAGVMPETAAQGENPVRWSLAAPRDLEVKPGGRFELALTATIDEGWHLYALSQGPPVIPTRITVPAGQRFSLAAPPAGPDPRREHDPNFDMETEFYDTSATFTVPILAAPDTPGGRQRAEVHVRFQTCNDRLCLPPRIEKLAVDVMVVGTTTTQGTGAAPVAPPPSTQRPTSAGGETSPATVGKPTGSGEASSVAAPAPASTAPSAPVTAREPVTAAREGAAAAAQGAPIVVGTAGQAGDLWAFIWLAMTVGALSLLTPCVFPMVPITVSYFTNHAAENRRAAVGNAFVYSAGIILTFTALGMLLALVVGASGLNRFAANPWINLLIAAIFLGFAMNLFGAYELTPPAALLTRLDSFTRREGGSRFAGTLLMGLTFTLTSFTCTAPFIGTLLVMASQGSWKWPLIGMLAFSAVFALPFFILALLPQLMSHLPRAGGWLNAVKVSMGFLEVAAAMKFVSNVDLVWGWNIFTREVVLATWVALGVLLCLYLLGNFRLTHDSPTERIGPWRLGWAIVSLAVTVHLVTGLFGRRLGELESFLPPATGTAADRGAGTLEGELAWIVNDYDSALAAASKEQRLVLIDFTGYTCTNCRWMEANMFPRPEIRAELERFVRVKLYTDGEGELYEKHQQFQATTFGTVALPLYAVMSVDGRPLATFPGLTRKPEEFIAFLRTPVATN
jgi:thiol:disulfide interchange protein DsbD